MMFVVDDLSKPSPLVYYTTTPATSPRPTTLPQATPPANTLQATPLHTNTLLSNSTPSHSPEFIQSHHHIYIVATFTTISKPLPQTPPPIAADS